MYHVYGHDAHPWNELVDSVSKALARKEHDFHMSELLPAALRYHRAIDWWWHTHVTAPSCLQNSLPELKNGALEFTSIWHGSESIPAPQYLQQKFEDAALTSDNDVLELA
eukprot:7442630-Karenia_brevis.AAC.1